MALAADAARQSACDKLHARGSCFDPSGATRFKIVAIVVILIASAVGVSAPLATRSIPALHPDRAAFAVLKAFSSGVILATGYMHVLPDSFDDLRSPCIPARPWLKFPFTSFIAMLSAVSALMADSLVMAWYRRKSSINGAAVDVENVGRKNAVSGGAGGAELNRNRVIVQVLEMGIIVHSVVIGLSLGASQSPCIIRPLVAALCFHQMFEGMGLGGCILQAEYGGKGKAWLAFFFSSTTPAGIALGMALSKVYSSTSATALIVEGVLNAASAGLLNYMALVDLLAADFMGPKLQGSIRLQLVAYAAVLAGAGLMSLMAKWA